MRSMWSGSLVFGLVNIPVKLYSATEERTPQFDFLHKKDLSPIRYAKVCKNEGEEVPGDEIVKGFEYRKGEYVVMNEEDFERARPRLSRSVEVVEFVQEEEIDSMYYDKPYYLEPDRGADKAYALLRDALLKSGRVGIAKYVIRNRERIGAVRPDGDVLVLNQLRYAAEVRQPEGLKLPASEQTNEREMELAMTLIEHLTEKFDPAAFVDTYSDELRSMIEQKAEGREIAPIGEAPEPTKVVDLMETLRASLEKAKAAA
jgi:DNA end-binding protein Ku